MTAVELNQLSALLIQLDIEEVKEEERIATKGRDFETLKGNAKIQNAITIILEYMEK